MDLFQNIGQEQDTLKQGILEQYSAFKNVYGLEGKNLTIKGDTAYTQGYGDIEFFNPFQGRIDYGNGNVVAHPDSGRYGVLYNPKKIKNVREAVIGDMLHGMSDDTEFAKLKDRFAKAAEKAGLKDNARYWYDKDISEGRSLDGFDSYWSNNVDGRIRQLFQPDHEEHEIFMQEMSDDMKIVGENIIKYMSSKDNNK